MDVVQTGSLHIMVPFSPQSARRFSAIDDSGEFVGTLTHDAPVRVVAPGGDRSP